MVYSQHKDLSQSQILPIHVLLIKGIQNVCWLGNLKKEEKLDTFKQNTFQNTTKDI